jgi:DNA polymerase elongation subunit (family B)
MTRINQDVLFGKDPTERVVSVELQGNSLIIFQEDKKGNVVQHSRYYRPWLLTPNKPDFGFTELKGSLYYRFIKEYDDYDTYKVERRQFDNCWAIYNDKEASLVKSGITYYKDMKYSEVSVLSFDIEGIGLVENDSHKTLMISNTFRTCGIITKKLFSIDEYESEKEMLLAWTSWVREKDPSILLGHNIYSYDFTYLQKCAENNGITLSLGRDSSDIRFKDRKLKPDRFRIDQSQSLEYYPCYIFGREIVDTYFLSQKYDVDRNYSNYKLKYLIEKENLVKEDRVFYDAKKIAENWADLTERDKIKKYCEGDGDDALALYDLMIPSFFYLANSIPKSFSDIINKAPGSQINSLMIRAYLQEDHSIPKASYSKELIGAISLGNVGTYKNVMKVDVKSMYPSIIRQYKIYDEDKDPKQYFLQMVDHFTEERFKNKRLASRRKERYYSDLEKAQKIIINSAFGFLATKGLLFNSPAKASFITQKGREILNDSILWANGKNFDLVNADTDSISFCKKGGSFINQQEQKELIKELNENSPEMIEWENDGVFKSMIVIKAKNYAYLLDDKLVIKGSGLKATGKELALKEMIYRIIKSLLGLSKEDSKDIYIEYIKEVVNIKDISRWGKRTKITEAVLNSERTNELKVRQALVGEIYSQGDIFFMYYDLNSNLKLTSKFRNDYDVDKLLEKTFKSMDIFSELFPTGTVLNFKLKRNKKILKDLLQN